MAKNDIDPAGEEVVLFYADEHAEGRRRRVPGIPARDLTGGDLARIAYARAHRAIEWERRSPKGEAPSLPGRASPKTLAALADELHATGIYRKTAPEAPAAEPAAEPVAAPEG